MTTSEPNHISAPAPELHRLINSVIWPGFVGTTVPGWLAKALENGLAGVVYFAHNIDPDVPGQVAALSAAIRAANPSAVIGVDEEGGNVTRLQARDGSTIPGAAVLGALNDLTTTAAAGRAIGRLCKDAGVNLTIAPVADVNTNPLNPVIGVRAFGAETALVSAHTAAAVQGIQELRVGACAKHFPGHGDTVADSHMDTARVELTMAQMEEFHLPPFRAAADAGVAAMMSAHIIIPELGEAPATLNPLAGALLRDMGYDGLLITDALDMAAVRATVGPGEGGVLALLAGSDLLCVGNPLNAYTTGRDDESCYVEVFDALLAAAESGRLPVEVLRRAAARVQTFADWSQEPVAVADSSVAEPDWVDVAARAALVSGDVKVLDPGASDTVVTVVDARTGHNMAAGPTENFIATALLEEHQVSTVPASELAADDFSELLAATASQGEPVLVIVDSLASPEQQATLALVAEAAPHAVCINAGLAPDSSAGGSPLATIHCHGFSRVSAEAVLRILTVSSTHDFAAIRSELGTLTTESSNPNYPDLAALTTAELVAAMNGEDALVPAAIAHALPTIAGIIDEVSRRMHDGGRLIYVGAGTPGRLGILDASECPPTFGTDPSRVVGVIAGGQVAVSQAVENAEDSAEAGAADMAALNLGELDSVVGIAASGRTPYVIAAINEARANGAFTVGFACNNNSPLGAAADVALDIEVGPEFLSGSTRLKSGTCQKLVLNMISTLTMVRLGKTYKNFMVDLRATNAKLHARSQRTLMRATGCDAATATAALEAADGHVKAAILSIMTGLPADQAVALLDANDGFLPAAISAGA